MIEAKQHPNADRLRVCIVDTGDGNPIQVVCGAPNARTGMNGVFSPPGTYIPGKKITLGVGTIRGVESRGMLVSEAEMELSDDHEGIIDLPDDAPVGESYAKWARLDDPVIEINLTPNRPDCTGVHGIARDLAAADMGKFIDPAPKAVKGAFPCPVSVTIESPELCPGFALRLVRGVKNGASPEWLQKRLIAIGLRPINALVDITNFMTFDRGRPLHVFDAAKVHGNLTVRRGRKGESLLALDGRTYQLDESICVIADEKAVESLSGIMGGEETGCSAETTDVLIESALWDAAQHRADRTQARHQFGRALSLRARRRSELHGAGPRTGDADGARLLRRHAVGDRRRGLARTPRIASSNFPVSEVKRLSGLDVPLTEMKRVLEHLGFFVGGRGRDREGRDPVMAAGHRGQGRHRRGGRAHRRRRQGAADAVRARRGCAQADPHAAAGAHPPRQARARERAAWSRR